MHKKRKNAGILPAAVICPVRERSVPPGNGSVLSGYITDLLGILTHLFHKIGIEQRDGLYSLIEIEERIVFIG